MTLKTAYEWADHLGVTIIDADGWRYDHTSMAKLITREDFMFRVGMSTVSITSLP